MLYLGIDIGGTSVKYGLVTAEGKIIKSAEYPVAFDSYRTPIMDTVWATSREFLNEHLTEAAVLAGIGVSATGQIDTVDGVVTGCGGNITNWKGTRIKEVLSGMYEVPVTVMNDANCAALAELWRGRARGCHHAVMVTIGTGVGGGIIVNDRILTGRKGFAGEIGHTPLYMDGKACTCGSLGCFEQYASMTALVNEVKKVLPLEGYIGLAEEEINGKVIFGFVRDGEPLVKEIVEVWIRDIAAGLTGLIHIFNPEIVLIGGGVSVQEELFIEKVKRQVRTQVMEEFARDLRVERAILGNDAGIIGAVYNLIQEMQL